MKPLRMYRIGIFVTYKTKKMDFSLRRGFRFIEEEHHEFAEDYAKVIFAPNCVEAGEKFKAFWKMDKVKEALMKRFCGYDHEFSLHVMTHITQEHLEDKDIDLKDYLSWRAQAGRHLLIGLTDEERDTDDKPREDSKNSGVARS